MSGYFGQNKAVDRAKGEQQSAMDGMRARRTPRDERRRPATEANRTAAAFIDRRRQHRRPPLPPRTLLCRRRTIGADSCAPVRPGRSQKRTLQAVANTTYSRRLARHRRGRSRDQTGRTPLCNQITPFLRCDCRWGVKLIAPNWRRRHKNLQQRR